MHASQPVTHRIDVEVLVPRGAEQGAIVAQEGAERRNVLGPASAVRAQQGANQLVDERLEPSCWLLFEQALEADQAGRADRAAVC